MSHRPWLSSSLAAALLLVLTLGASAAPREARTLHGDAVRPRIFRFSDLPRQENLEHLPITLRKEHEYEKLAEKVEELKRHPQTTIPANLHILNGDSRSLAGGPLAPTTGTGFEGITQAGFIPGEPTVAGGPLNIFSAGNISVTVTNKDGTNRVETNGQTFFGVPGPEGAISDAQCYYDALRNRFVALAFTQGTSPSNYCNYYLAISQTNDARGAWYQYKFDMTKDGNSPTTNWGDYQALGVSDDKIAFTSQQFSFAGNSYQYQKIRIIDRALAYTGAPVGYVDFVGFTAPSGDDEDWFCTKAARNLTLGDNTIHCVCVRVGGGSRVTYRTVTGPPASPTLNLPSSVTTSAYTAPPDAEQMGTATLVATNDCRPTDFYVRNGVLTLSWHTGVTISAKQVSGIRLFQMRTSDRAVLTDETYASANTFMFYPAVVTDSVGTVYLGYGRSNTNEFPSAWVTGKRRSDVTLQSSVLVKAGLAGTSQSRWGDYTGIDNDAAASGPGGTVAWYAGQWTKAANTFGTWIQQLSFSYAQIAGTVVEDCDQNTGTTGDRGPVAGITLTLKQGANTVATLQTDAGGAYNFGYLESGTYDILVTPPGGGAALDAIPGSGATSQTRISESDIQVAITNTQTSTGNQFVITKTHPVPTASNLSPTSVASGSGALTLTINGSNFSLCSIVRLDGSDRATTFVNAGQLTAAILGPDVASPGVHTITVFNPPPAGGTSNGLPFTATGTDNTPPTATITSPTGGESWDIGSTQSITWTASDDIGVSGIDLDYSTDGGVSFPFTIAHGLLNTGSYSWTVPGTPSTTARVRVIASDPGGNLASDSSHTDFTIAGYTITATAGANGTVTPSGVTGYPPNATPSYTITPNTGYSIVDVLVDGNSAGAITSYAFAALSASHTISATFVVNTYTLSVTVVGNGSVAKAPDQATYDHGTNVQLTATADPGWAFGGWSGDASGFTNPLTVSMTSNKSITATFTLHIYAWNKTGTAAWGTAANWTPQRATPNTDDVLLFNGGGVTTVTGVPTQAVNQILLSNGTGVTLQPTLSNTLTINGQSGTDLDVPAGTSLTVTGGTLVFALGASATGSVGGAVTLSAAGDRLTALGTGAIEFLGGSLFTQGGAFTGNPFGTGAGTSALNSVIFRNGALYVQVAGANPFGASAPNSVVTFQPGSRYRLDANLTPSFAGRTYADFEFNTTGPISVSGGTGLVTLDSLIVTKGTLNINMTTSPTAVAIKGAVVVKPAATLTFSPTVAATTTLNGSAQQRVDVGLGAVMTTNANATMNVNNANGIVLTGPVTTLGGPLSFTSGKVLTGGNVLAIGATGSVVGASNATGYVAGNLRRNFATGASKRLFDIGDLTRYAPVSLSVNTAPSALDYTASTTGSDHPSLGTSDLNPAKSCNRYWTLAQATGPTTTVDTALVMFTAPDLDAGAQPLAFLVRRFAGSWNVVTNGTRTTTSTIATGLTTLGDISVAELAAYTLAVTASGPGTVAKVPNQATYPGNSNVQVTATPTAGYSFVGWSGDATGATNPLSVTMTGNKAITATFADTTLPIITVSAPNGGELMPIGSSQNVTWTASDNIGVTLVDLLLSRAGAGGPFDPIATGIANSGTFNWTVTGPPTGTALVRAVAHDAAGYTGDDVSDLVFNIYDPTAVEAAVTEFAMTGVRPNPMHDLGTIGFALPQASTVRLSIHDLQGREIRVLASGTYGPGRHDAVIAGVGAKGLEPGMYFARLQVAGRTFVRRFVMTR